MAWYVLKHRDTFTFILSGYRTHNNVVISHKQSQLHVSNETFTKTKVNSPRVCNNGLALCRWQLVTYEDSHH